MDARKTLPVRMGLALAVFVVAALVNVPSRADTSSDLQATKAKVAALQSELNRLAASYAAAEARFAVTQSRIDAVAARVQRLRSTMASLRAELDRRAWAAYEAGGADTLELLLASDSFSDFSDRVEYLGHVQQNDTDLLLEARVTGEQLRRSEADLRKLSASQAATVASLQGQKSAIAAAFSQAQALQADLQRRLQQERAEANAPAPIRSGGALQACPVGQPRSFVDTFGAPRSGGRRHQGIDLMAPYGTPVYAAQSGRFVQNNNDLGGISALVYAANGDYTYYAHMSSYAGVASGAKVTAGTVIGHVGNTGDAAGGPYHLHFEYHPGGGGAVDPYNLLRAVCG